MNHRYAGPCYGMLLAAACLFSRPAAAQTDASRAEHFKIVSERRDKNGNTVRTIQYEKDGKRVTEIQTIMNIIGTHVAISPDTLNRDSLMIVINKSKYDLEVYYRRKLVRCYKAVFGPRPMENKKMAGDRCTPEGWFRIRSINPKSKYDKFMLLDYPNDSSYAQFNRLKQRGEVPANADIGGNVGIHGIWKGGDDLIEAAYGWTDGCIALKNKDIDDLFPLVSAGTRVYIRK